MPVRRLLLAAGLVVALLFALTVPVLADGDSFNPKDWPLHINTKHFIIYYTDQGPERVDPADAKAAAAAMEDAYDRLITRGGLPPVLQTPFPVVVQVGEEGVGGTMLPTDLAYKQHITLNVTMLDWTTWQSTAAHELFHAIQWVLWGWDPPDRDDWVVEGTAAVVPLLAYADRPELAAQMVDDHLGGYWSGHSDSLYEQSYDASLFWYDLARRYGGLDFLHRFIYWGANYDFRVAAQLAALEGGAPADTTFDSLYRQFLIDLATGQIDLDYPEGTGGELQVDHYLVYTGEARTWTHAPNPVVGLDFNMRPYTYTPRLRVRPYAFNWLNLFVGTDQAFTLGLQGGDGLELFVFGLDPTNPAAAVRIEDGQTATLRVPEGTELSLAVARFGDLGTGNYGLSIKPAAAGAALTKPAAPKDLVADGPDGVGPGAPGPLSAAQLNELAGKPVKTPTLDVAPQAPAGNHDVIAFLADVKTAITRTRTLDLQAPPYLVKSETGFPVIMVAAGDLALAGVQVSNIGHTAVFEAGGQRWTLSEGSNRLQGPYYDYELQAPSEWKNGRLMVPADVLNYLGWQSGPVYSDDTHAIYYKE
jgi:hypothetical protein